MATPLRKPVARAVDIPSVQRLPVTVTLTSAGITFRPYGCRTVYLLPYGVAYVRAVHLEADQIIRSRRARRASRGLLATEAGR